MRAAFGLFSFSMERLDLYISALGPVASETMLPPVSSWSHFKEQENWEQGSSGFQDTMLPLLFGKLSCVNMTNVFCGLGNIGRGNGEKNDNFISNCKMGQTVFQIIQQILYERNSSFL